LTDPKYPLPDTGAYGQAHQQLPEILLHRLGPESAEQLEQQVLHQLPPTVQSHHNLLKIARTLFVSMGQKVAWAALQSRWFLFVSSFPLKR